MMGERGPQPIKGHRLVSLFCLWMLPLRFLGYDGDGENRRFDFTMLAGIGLSHMGGVCLKSPSGAARFSYVFGHLKVNIRCGGVSFILESVKASGKTRGSDSDGKTTIRPFEGPYKAL